MKVRKLIESFNAAIDGIIYSVRTQKNMRIHFSIAIAILVFSLFFDLSKSELMILFLSITLVIAAEMINTAIESTIDMFANYYHPLAKIAKNVAAGAVLVSAINAILVGYLLFFDKLVPMANMVVNKVKQSPPHITFITLALVMLIVIAIKAYFGEGTPLKGGMPSGHSAIAFSFATMIAMLTADALIATMSYLMALLVVQTRLEAKVHSMYEVAVGGILGVFITIIIFQLFR